MGDWSDLSNRDVRAKDPNPMVREHCFVWNTNVLSYFSQHYLLLVGTDVDGQEWEFIYNLTNYFDYNRLSKKSCGIFIDFSIIHKIGYNNAI